jgi:hypothetical protein
MSLTVMAPNFVGEGLGPQLADHVGVADQLLDRPAGRGDDLLDHRVGFRVHARQVQRVVAIADAQEARGLLEGLGAQAGHVQQLLAVAEGAVGVAPAHDAVGHRGGQARDRASSGAEAVFRSTPTEFTQSSTTASSVRASSLWLTSCWYWPTPMLLGSIFTSSASGSCRRRAMDTAPRRLTSRSGSSLEANSRPSRPRRRPR